MAAKQTVQKLIDENVVVLFGKSYCGFCTSSRTLLASLKIEFHDVNLDLRDDGNAMQDALEEMTHQRTVPNIFINQKHIGGNSDLQGLGDKLLEMVDGKK